MRSIALALTVCLTATGTGAETLTILHTNDFHSRIEPINKFNSGCAAEDNDAGKCFGGSARLVTAVRAARAASNLSILVDGGDQFQGSLFYTRYKGQTAAEMMNAIGYDAMTVGNHEFDDGPEVLRAFMDRVEFPVLMSNADVSGEPKLANVLMPSTVIERGGEKIGLIGLTPQDTPDLASPGPNIRFHDPVEAVAREVQRLEADGISRIIVLSHSGFVVDQFVASRVNGIDVIVGGHSNTFLSNTSDRAAGPYPTWVTSPDGGRTAIVQAYAFGKYLGRLDVSFDAQGVVTAAVGEPILIDGKVTEDSSLKARISELAKPFVELRNKVIGSTVSAIDGAKGNCRSGECAMGNLVAEAMLDRMKGQGVTIAIQNGGGLRASIDAGDITMGEILTVLPFQNAISTFQLKGSDVVAALEGGVSGIEEGKGRFPQVAGLRYEFDPAIPPNTGRITKVEVLKDDTWTAIDPEALYTIASNDFLRSGGDGYVTFAENAINAYDYGPGLEEVVVDFLGKTQPYEPFLDGRISSR